MMQVQTTLQNSPRPTRSLADLLPTRPLAEATVQTYIENVLGFLARAGSYRVAALTASAGLSGIADA